MVDWTTCLSASKTLEMTLSVDIRASFFNMPRKQVGMFATEQKFWKIPKKRWDVSLKDHSRKYKKESTGVDAGLRCTWRWLMGELEWSLVQMSRSWLGRSKKCIQASQPLPVSHVPQGTHSILCPRVQKSCYWHSGPCSTSQPSLMILADGLWILKNTKFTNYVKKNQ